MMPKKLTLTLSLIVLNAVIFFASSSLPYLKEQLSLFFPENQRFHVWQFVTHMFMHGSVSHLLFNMFALLSFGLVLERLWGAKRFLIFYLLVGVGAALIHIAINILAYNSALAELNGLGYAAVDIKDVLAQGKYFKNVPASEKAASILNSPMVGASGAIYGVLVAFACLFPNHKLILLFLPFPIAAKYFVPAVLSLDLFSGITGFSIFGGNIAHFAHLGGAFIGFLLMIVWRKKGFSGQHMMHGD